MIATKERREMEKDKRKKFAKEGGGRRPYNNPKKQKIPFLNPARCPPVRLSNRPCLLLYKVERKKRQSFRSET
jgi:hypothetical protein